MLVLRERSGNTVSGGSVDMTYGEFLSKLCLLHAVINEISQYSWSIAVPSVFCK